MAGVRPAVPPSPATDEPFTLHNASVPLAVTQREPSGQLGRFDIAIADGRIAAITPAGQISPSTGPVYDMDRGLVLPALVDMHTHLDKGHIWRRAPNPDGTFQGAIETVEADRRARWRAGDVEARMDFALRCAHAHGTAAIRTHIDSAPPQLEISWEVFDRVRARWAGRIELQAVAIVGPDVLLDRPTLQRVAGRVAASGGVLGGVVLGHPDLDRAITNVVEMAGESGLALDLHCDETLDPGSHALDTLARKVCKTGFDRPVVAGHCCSLAAQDEREAWATIERVAEAKIAVVSLPMCNLYLQDRQPPGMALTPRRRGVTLVSELKAAGVQVALASDNTRDPFYAYGDLDTLEVLREGARIAHFDHPETLAFDWLRAMTAVPAAIAGFAHKGQIEAGAPADLVLLSARDWTELNARPQADRVVLRRGMPIDTTPPDYRELDELME